MTNLLSCYTIIVPVTFILIFAYVNVLSRYSNPPSEVLGAWFSFLFELFGHAYFVYLGAFSLFTAGIKYWYIVKNANARRFGEEKARTIFLISHLVIPIIVAGLNSISNGNKDLLFWVNHCWSHKPKTDSGISEQTGDFVCSNRQYDISKYVGEKARHYIEPIQQGICGGLKIFYLAFCLNMAEFILYVLVFKYLNR